MASSLSSIVRGKRYFLHLRDKAIEEETSAEILKFGGKISEFLDTDVNIVVSDHPSVGLLIDSKKASTVLPNRSVSVDDGRSSSSETRPSKEDAATISKFTNVVSKGSLSGIGAKSKIGTRRSLDEDTKLANVPLILKEANRMNLQIVRYSDLADSLKSTQRRNKFAPAKKCISTGIFKPRIFRLREPFIKLEDRSRKYRPVFEALDRWPKINNCVDREGCIFAEDNDDAKTRKSESSKSSLSAARASTPKKKKKAARKLNFDQTQKAGQTTDSASLTLTTTELKKNGESRRAPPGFCELCNLTADMTEHLKSDIHQKNVNSQIYQRLDDEIAKGPTLEQFLAQALHSVSADNKGVAMPLLSPKSKPSPRRQTDKRHSVPRSPTIFSPIRRQLAASVASQSPGSTLMSPKPLRSPISGRRQSFIMNASESPIIPVKASTSDQNGQMTVKTRTDLSALK